MYKNLIFKYLNGILVALCCLLFWVACENPPMPETPTEKLANSLCNCTENLLNLNEGAQKSPDSLLFRKIALAFEQSKKCVLKIGISPADQISVESVLPQKCPRLAQEKALLFELFSR